MSIPTLRLPLRIDQRLFGGAQVAAYLAAAIGMIGIMAFLLFSGMFSRPIGDAQTLFDKLKIYIALIAVSAVLLAIAGYCVHEASRKILWIEFDSNVTCRTRFGKFVMPWIDVENVWFVDGNSKSIELTLFEHGMFHLRTSTTNGAELKARWIENRIPGTLIAKKIPSRVEAASLVFVGLLALAVCVIVVAHMASEAGALANAKTLRDKVLWFLMPVFLVAVGIGCIFGGIQSFRGRRRILANARTSRHPMIPPADPLELDQSIHERKDNITR